MSDSAGLKYTFTPHGVIQYICVPDSKVMSDTFQCIAERAAGERQIIRKSQFSKEIFCSGKAVKKNIQAGKANSEILIIC